MQRKKLQCKKKCDAPGIAKSSPSGPQTSTTARPQPASNQLNISPLKPKKAGHRKKKLQCKKTATQKKTVVQKKLQRKKTAMRQESQSRHRPAVLKHRPTPDPNLHQTTPIFPHESPRNQGNAKKTAVQKKLQCKKNCNAKKTAMQKNCNAKKTAMKKNARSTVPQVTLPQPPPTHPNPNQPNPLPFLSSLDFASRRPG